MTNRFSGGSRVAAHPTPQAARAGDWPLPREVVWTLCAVVLIVGIDSEVGRRLHLATRAAEVRVDHLRERPPSFYRLEWKGVQLPSEVHTGEELRVLVSFRNAGDETWPDPQTADPVDGRGAGAVRLGWRWWDAGAEEVAFDPGGREDLPFALGHGETHTFAARVAAPDRPGDYELQVDLVHELVTWFEARGADRMLVPVTVEPPG